MKFFLTLFILYIKNANIKFNYNLMSRKFIPNQKSLKSRTTNYSNFLDTYKTFNLKIENSNINQSSFSENSINLNLYNNFLSFLIIAKHTNEIYSHIDLSENKIFDNSSFIKILFNIIKKNWKQNKNNLKKINFDKIFIQNYYILILQIEKIDFYFIGIFNNNQGNSIKKLLLLHLVIAFLNLKKNIKIKEKLYNDIFNELFIIPLIKNFEILFSKINKRKDIILHNNIQYKTSFVIELSSNKILFNLTEQNSSSIYKKEKLWEEILFLSHHLKQNYENEHKNISNEEYYKNSYIKLECRATYPRKIFLIKFLPILKGCCLIHIFNQYKLSKTQTNNFSLQTINDTSTIGNGYKEFEIIYGYDDNELKYFENIDLKKIENFFIEYFTCSKDLKNEMYFFFENKQIKYINNEILKIINNELSEDNFKNSIQNIKQIFETIYLENNNKEIDISDNNDKNKNDPLYISKIQFLNYFKNIFKNKDLDTTNSLSENQTQNLNSIKNLGEVLDRININDSQISNILLSKKNNNIEQKSNDKGNNKNINFYSNNQIIHNSIISEPFHLDITKISNYNIDTNDINISNNIECINQYENKNYSKESIPAIKCDTDKIDIESFIRNN